MNTVNGTCEVQLKQAGHIFWKMGFGNIKMLESSEHALAAVKALLWYSATTTLSQLERCVLLEFAALEGDFDSSTALVLADKVKGKTDILLTPHECMGVLNDAVDKLSRVSQLRNTLTSLALTARRHDEREPVSLPNLKITLSSTGACVDAVGRQELLQRMFGSREFAKYADRLQDPHLVEQIDCVIEEGCRRLSDTEQGILRTLYGVDRTRLDFTALMQKHQCGHEDIKRGRDASIAVLERRGVVGQIAQLLGTEPQPATAI